ncbi:MAG: hypothetical protein ACI9IN_001202, partial [Porticoccaceae bacterium]
RLDDITPPRGSKGNIKASFQARRGLILPRRKTGCEKLKTGTNCAE